MEVTYLQRGVITHSSSCFSTKSKLKGCFPVSVNKVISLLFFFSVVFTMSTLPNGCFICACIAMDNIAKLNFY